MLVKCKFPNCDWNGLLDVLFEHCEKMHKNFIREIENENHFKFTFEDFIQMETILLCGNNGLYWLTQNLNDESDFIAKGIFPIGDSEIINFTLKIGSIRNGFAVYLGPYSIKSDNSNNFDIILDYEYINYVKEQEDTKTILYFGDYDDSDDVFMGESCDVDWDEHEEAVNSELLEKFTCSVCLEYIKADARFCENKHFTCINCFEELIQRKSMKCPICRGIFKYDCKSQAVEDLLKLMKFPE